MDFPISKIDIEYLIDAAEKTSEEKYRPKYFPYILYEEANKLLTRFENHQTELFGPAENTADLETRLALVLSSITDNGTHIPERPAAYGENESIFQKLLRFYSTYFKDDDQLSEEDETHKKWGILGPDFQVLEERSAWREKILTTSKALRTALKMLTRLKRGDTSEEDFIQENGIPVQFLRHTEYDEGSNETYNIIPFDGAEDWLPEVVEWDIRVRDVLNRLQKFFGFQESSVSNQRENIVNLLSNEQMRLGECEKVGYNFFQALENVFLKSLDNYITWCSYLREAPIWTNMDAISKEEKIQKQILYISLYYLIWGEAANVRFLPECLCYIFHHMSKQLDDKYSKLMSGQLDVQHSGSFIDQVIQPLYEVIAADAKIKKERDVPHSKWRNYDDFNEYFWSPDCLRLGSRDSPYEWSTMFQVYGKTSFVEHRTFLHLYHSFHRMWILHVMIFQALVIFAFNNGKLNSKTLREFLTTSITYFLMKLIQSMLDIVLKYGAYSKTSRVDVLRSLFRFIWFMLATLIICFPRMKCLQEKTSSIEESIGFKIYITVLGIYAVFKIFFSILSQSLSKKYENSFVARFIKWINQEEYVGRDMDEKPTDYIKYTIFWLVTLGINFAYTYYYLIMPLVRPTRDITDVSKNIHNMLAIGSLWASVICAYIVGSHISYNVISAFVGTFVGRRDRLGKIKFLGDVHKCFDKIPTAFMGHLQNRESRTENEEAYVKKLDAAEFKPFWNKIVMNLREEDYISHLEHYALRMLDKSWRIDVIQWPLFLLVGKVSLARKIAAHSISQEHMWNEISRDVYMKYAVQECFHSVKYVLSSVLDSQEWVLRIDEGIRKSIAAGKLCSEFQLDKLESFVKEISGLLKILNMQKYPVNDRLVAETLKNNANDVLNNVINHEFINHISGNNTGGGLDFDLVTRDPELRSQIERLCLLLTMDKSADHVPRNREARRRLEFFTNSLFMSMPKTVPVRKMLSFSVLTPCYSEAVLYSLDELELSNDDGITLIDYLKNLYPDEWINFCERMKRRDKKYVYDRELRLWASYRGQTLARTVRGTMYYQKALLFQAYREMLIAESSALQGLNERLDKAKAECLDKAKAHVDLKFTYVVSCQIYGKQKMNGEEKAADIAFLLKRNEGLRVAYVDEVNNEFYSKLVKADKNGKETEVYSIKLPGDPILGEGKPENQNHAIVFTRGNAIQTIDMNQDNYFEEALKMRNLLEEFHRDDAIRPATILGIREHIFTGSASSLASFMSNQETSFVTLGQRVMAKPLNVRMHYGHPDVFDRVFHITRGGISKASRGINISEDVYAGFNSTLRKGRVTHHEYIQVGKGRDVGFNQIAIFEGKVAGGNGEQVLSRDMYRLGQRYDFFRMLSFYYTTVGYYFSSLLMVITLYILLYGNFIMALSGTRVPHVLNDTAMTPELILMIVLLPALYIILVLILEQGFEKAVESFLTMFSRLCSIFFAFSLGTRIHWFGRTIIHGGASYQATGRGFVLHHIKFSEHYRLYSRSHFVKGMEVLFLLVVYCIYGFHSVRAIYNNLLLLGGLILSISWIVAPFLFDSSAFDLNKNSEDWKDWNNWLNCESVKVEESWKVWWNKELSHIRTPIGRVIETILCLRFFIFLYVVIYKIDVQGSINSLLICGHFWILFVLILFGYEVLSNKDPMNVPWFKQVIHRNRSVATIGALAIAFCTSHVGDMLAFIIAFITTLWGILSICVAWKPTLVTGLAKICDAGMGTLMFNIASMLSRRSIKQYLVRNMFDHNVSEYLQKGPQENASLYGEGF